MSDLAVVALSVRPLPGAAFRQMPAGEAVTVGDLVYVKNDGKVYKADASIAGTAFAVGVVVAVSTFGKTVAAAGDMVSVQMAGPVAGFTVTPGARIFVSDTAGKAANTVGTVEVLFGIGLPDNVLWIMPCLFSPDALGSSV